MSEVHWTTDSRADNFQVSFALQHGHVVSCSGVLGSPGDRLSASCRVSGVVAAPTQSPIPIGADPRSGAPVTPAALFLRRSSHAQIIDAARWNCCTVRSRSV